MKLIIDDTSGVPLHSRVGWGCGTALCWVFWSYLWLPLIPFVATGLGLPDAYNAFRTEKDAGELGRLMKVYIAVIVTLGGTLLLWAKVEHMRFRQRRRHGDQRPVAHAELAKFAELPVALLSTWTSKRHLCVHHSDDGLVTHMEVLDALTELRMSA